jgi:hypothetical protein
MSIDRYQVANEAYNFYGDPPPSASNSWWEDVKKWIENYLKPLVHVAELTHYVAQIYKIYVDIVRRRI